MDPRSHLFSSRWLNVGVSSARGLRRLTNLESDLLHDAGSMIDRIRFRLMHCNPELRQAVFHLLGKYFVVRHLCPPHIFNPPLLNSLEPRVRGEALKEARAMLDEELKEAMHKMELEQVLSNRKNKLVMDVATAISKELETELQARLQRSKKIKVVKKRRESSKSRNRNKKSFVELEDTSGERQSFVFETLQEMLEKRHDPHLELLVLNQLRSRILVLAPQFRSAIFTLLYCREQEQYQVDTKFDEVDDKFEERLEVEEYTTRLRAAFDERVRERLEKYGGSLDNWSGRRVIDVAVLLAFERSPGLRRQLADKTDMGDFDDDQLDFCTSVLSLHSVVSHEEDHEMATETNSRSANLVFWLLNIHACIPSTSLSSSSSREERVFTSAFYFDLFAQQTLMSTEQLFKMAEQVYEALSELESELVQHVSWALLEDLEPDPTLFSPDILAPYASESEELLRRFLERRAVSQLNDLQRLADLRLFVRKWIAEIFVCVLDNRNAQLVFDTLLLHKFRVQLVIEVCLALFHLLKPSLMKAHNHVRVRDALLGGDPIAMRDLRRVLKHLVNGGQYRDIPHKPNVPDVMLTPASPATERREAEAKHRRIDALNQSMHLLYAD